MRLPLPERPGEGEGSREKTRIRRIPTKNNHGGVDLGAELDDLPPVSVPIDCRVGLEAKSGPSSSTVKNATWWDVFTEEPSP